MINTFLSAAGNFLTAVQTTTEQIVEAVSEIATAEVVRDLIPFTDESFLGRLKYGGLVTVIGLAFVFFVLIILWGILELMGYINVSLAKRKNAEKELTEIPDEVYIPAPAEDIPIPDGDEEAEEEIAAVIAAAIAAASEAAGKPQTEFRVVSFKKTNYNVKI